jgi:hypothetical protein
MPWYLMRAGPPQNDPGFPKHPGCIHAVWAGISGP